MTAMEMLERKIKVAEKVEELINLLKGEPEHTVLNSIATIMVCYELEYSIAEIMSACDNLKEHL